MDLIGEQVLLRAYLRSGDRTPFAPTYERVVKAARFRKLAGCTVLQGIAGFHVQVGMLKSSAWSLVEHVPVIVEIVDSAAQVTGFIQESLHDLMYGTGAMITLERAHAMMYRHRHEDPPGKLELGALLDQPLSTTPEIEMSDLMTTNRTGVLLRIFAGESDRAGEKPLQEAILSKARELGLANATVLRGIEGFGANSIVHKAKLLEMSTDLPIVVEIVDTEERVRRLLPYLEAVVNEGMITMEHVSIISYKHGNA